MRAGFHSRLGAQEPARSGKYSTPDYRCCNGSRPELSEDIEREARGLPLSRGGPVPRLLTLDLVKKIYSGEIAGVKVRTKVCVESRPFLLVAHRGTNRNE